MSTGSSMTNKLMREPSVHFFIIALIIFAFARREPKSVCDEDGFDNLLCLKAEDLRSRGVGLQLVVAAAVVTASLTVVMWFSLIGARKLVRGMPSAWYALCTAVPLSLAGFIGYANHSRMERGQLVGEESRLYTIATSALVLDCVLFVLMAVVHGALEQHCVPGLPKWPVAP